MPLDTSEWRKFNKLFWLVFFISILIVSFYIYTGIASLIILYTFLVVPSAFLGFLLVFFSHKIRKDWSEWWVFFTAFPVALFSIFGWVRLYREFSLSVAPTSKLIDVEWNAFKAFFWLDVLSVFAVLFFGNLWSFSPALQGIAMMIDGDFEMTNLLAIKFFQIASLFVYGRFGSFFGNNNFIGLWKVVPFFGYIPLYYAIRRYKDSKIIEDNNN